MSDRDQVPQTVSFEIEIDYGFIQREEAKLPRQVRTKVDSFEGMLDLYRTERCRRAYKHRATAGRYRMHLTDTGREACKDPARAESHKDAINGTWFAM